MSWEQPGVISREECSLVPPTLMHCLDFSSWAWIMKEERWGTGFTMHLLNSFLFAFVFVLSEAQPQDSQGCTLSHVWQGPRVLCETYLGLWVTQTGWRIRWWGEGKRMENMTQTMAGTQTLSWPLLVTVWSVSCATHRPSDREGAHLGPCHQMPGSKSHLSHWSAVYLQTGCRILCIFTALWNRSEIVQIGSGNSIGISHGKHLVYGHNKRLLIKLMSE